MRAEILEDGTGLDQFVVSCDELIGPHQGLCKPVAGSSNFRLGVVGLEDCLGAHEVLQGFRDVPLGEDNASDQLVVPSPLRRFAIALAGALGQQRKAAFAPGVRLRDIALFQVEQPLKPIGIDYVGIGAGPNLGI